MVKSETLFCRLISIDTLLSFDGVIPSAADFQLKLTSLIEQLNKALLTENQAQTDSEALCRALCYFFDKRLTSDQQNNSLTWQRYSLVHYFYGHNENSKDLTLPAQLDVLLSTGSEAIFGYAWKLLTLLIQIEGHTETLVSLRTASRPRYLSRVRTHLTKPASAPMPWVEQNRPQGELPRLMVFIIGPFASKWFNQSDLSTSNHSDIIWVVVEHATSLSKRLAYLKENYNSMATLAFLPLLVDGFENSGVMIEQITTWQHALSSLRISEHLPCMLGIYTRLSQQRYPHDPDQAIWIGGLTAPPHENLKLESCFTNLASELESCNDSNDLCAIQRQAMGSTLILWLAESRIMGVLQNLFDNTSLTLVGVTLADHGQGFIRHGAWSQWLVGKYGILPGLAASIAIPPLPLIPLPPLVEIEQVDSTPIAATISEPASQRWSKISMLLAILIGLASTLYYYAKPDVDETRWLKSVKMLFQKQDTKESTTLFELSGIEPLFEIGSSNLMPDSEKMLEEIIPKIVRVPQQVFLIIGHSDNTGSPAVNLALSIKRAQFIQSWLIQHTGLPASQFIIKGAGNSRPVANNDTQAGRAQNRRVEIIPLSMQGNKD